MQLMDTFNDSADRMVKFIAAQADDGKAEVSMLDAIERVTLDVIAKVRPRRIDKVMFHNGDWVQG